MRVQSFEVQGLRGADGVVSTDLGARVDLPVGSPGIAWADGLSLLQAALASEPSLQATLEALGLWRPEATIHLDAYGLPEQVVGLDPGGVTALIAESTRRIILHGTFTLDPVLFGQLREQSSRDPRVVTALGQDATVGIKVGWLFTPDLAAASVSVLELAVGEVLFPLHAEERPRWASDLLSGIRDRLGRVEIALPIEGLGARLLDDALSFAPQCRGAVRRLAMILAEPPFSLGQMEWVRSEGRVELVFGPQMLRARQLGPQALRRVRLAASALVLAPDVLIVDEEVPPEIAAWLVDCIEGPEATLEQVIFVGGGA